MAPSVMISHNTTPKAHTSVCVEYTPDSIASGAIHRYDDAAVEEEIQARRFIIIIEISQLYLNISAF